MTTDIYNKYANKYGEIIFQGRCYALLADPSLTNRLFDGGWNPYLQDGDEYISEWSAPAIGDNGEEYVVIWRFATVKGQELEDDGDWPWGNVYSVVAA